MISKKGMMMNPRRIVVALCAAVFKSPEPEEFLVEIQSMVIYPYYNRNKQDDIAVIKLKRTIKFDGYHLAKAVIGNASLEVGNDCKTVGGNFGIRVGIYKIVRKFRSKKINYPLRDRDLDHFTTCYSLMSNCDHLRIV